MREPRALIPDLPPPVHLLGVAIHPLSPSAVVAFIVRAAQSREQSYLAYANVHALNLAQDLPWFRSFLKNAAVIFCDGFGVKWGAKILGVDIPHRFTPPDWFPLLAETFARQGLSMFLLGARPAVIEKFTAQLQSQHPGLKLLGYQHGYFDRSPGSLEEAEIIARINACRPDLLVIGLGMPLQERWLVEHWEHLDVRVALPVGAMYDYLTGEVRRAPAWMTNHGLEWLGRLLIEPGRLWHRYLLGNPRFFLAVLKQRFGLADRRQ